jgi:hypothetical protein
MKDIIAERKLTGIDKAGKQFPICIRVGKPYRASDIVWACPVEAVGLRSKLADQHGVDSFQATVLAFGLLQSLINEFIAGGGKVLGLDGRTEVNVLELFKSGT